MTRGFAMSGTGGRPGHVQSFKRANRGQRASRKAAAGGRTGGRGTGAFLRLPNQRAVPPRIRRYIVMASHIAK